MKLIDYRMLISIIHTAHERGLVYVPKKRVKKWFKFVQWIGSSPVHIPKNKWLIGVEIEQTAECCAICLDMFDALYNTPHEVVMQYNFEEGEEPRA